MGSSQKYTPLYEKDIKETQNKLTETTQFQTSNNVTCFSKNFVYKSVFNSNFRQLKTPVTTVPEFQIFPFVSAFLIAISDTF